MNERLLHRREKGMFEKIQGDRELLKKITIDMLKFGGKLTPILHWHMVHKAEQEKDECMRVQYSDTMTVERYEESFDDFYQSSDQFLDAWIGSAGCQPWTEQLLESMTPFLKRVDAMNLFDRMLKTPEIDWLYTDLHTVVDVNLLNSYLFTAEEEYHILEVGGGMAGWLRLY